MKRIYFLNFLNKLAFLFWEGTMIEKMKFVFFMLDWDQDGMLTGYDLLKSIELVPEQSKFG